MSEAKFTKGDWRVQVTETNHGRNILEVVTNTFDVCCYKLGIRNKYDANLIAAAPEMYDLLERLTDHNNCKKDIIHLLGEADNLLAKARGES